MGREVCVTVCFMLMMCVFLSWQCSEGSNAYQHLYKTCVNVFFGGKIFAIGASC